MKKIYSLQKKRLWATMLVTLTFGLSVHATVWPVPNSAEDTLQGLIERNDAMLNHGDTILLISSGTYNELGTIDFFKELTIMGDPNLASRPVVQFQDNGFRPKEDTMHITIKNINFNGNKDGGGNAGFVLRMKIGTSYWKNIIMEDIEAWGMQGLLDLDENKHSIYDTVIINNVVCHDFVGNQFVVDPNINYAKYISITNSTFYNIQGGFLKNPDWNGNGTLDVVKEWIVDHNTFYKVGGSNNCILQQNDPDDGSVDLTFTNNIVSKLYDNTNARPFRINELAGDFVIGYSVFHDYDVTAPTKMQFNFDTIVNQANIDTMVISRADPMFADTAFYNFTLYEDNPLFSFASDGGPIGDPRWVSYETPWEPGPNCWMIPNTAEDTLQGLIERSDSLLSHGDTIVLVSNGVYNELGTIDMFKELTIMGDPRLADRPVVQFQDNGFRPKEDTINVTIKNINFNGNKDGGGNAGFVLRMKIGTTYWKNIIMEDIEAWGMQGLLDLDENKHSIYDTVIINNVVCHDFVGNQFVIDPNINYAKYISVTNSTFYKVSGFLKNPDWNGNGTLDIQKEWIVDHNTFYKVGGSNNCILQQNDPDDDSVDLTFTNNIVSKLYDNTNARPFRINELAGDFVLGFSVFHEYDVIEPTKMQFNLDTVVNQANVDTISISKADPMFADTTVYDFTIPDDSPLYSASTTGAAIGDPRWAPLSTSKPIVISPVLEKVWPGKAVALEVSVDLPDGADETVTWSIMDGHGGTSGAGTINDTGLFVASAVGDVKVIATSNYNEGFFDTLIVSIEEQVLVSSINLSSSTDVLARIGSFATITAEISPDNADDKDIEWTVSDYTFGNIIVKTSVTAELVAKIEDGSTITVTATAQDGSSVTGTIDIQLGEISSVSKVSLNNIKVMPNPATDYIMIQTDQTVEVIMNNVVGAIVLSEIVEPNSTIDISSLKAGIYIVNVKADNKVTSIRLIKED